MEEGLEQEEEEVGPFLAVEEVEEEEAVMVQEKLFYLVD